MTMLAISPIILGTQPSIFLGNSKIIGFFDAFALLVTVFGDLSASEAINGVRSISKNQAKALAEFLNLSDDSHKKKSLRAHNARRLVQFSASTKQLTIACQF